MKLFEIFDSRYVIKKIENNVFTVSKFRDRKEPEAVYDVVLRGNLYWTSSPGFKYKGQDEKHIKLVKQFIADGEPLMRAYIIDDSDKITSHNI